MVPFFSTCANYKGFDKTAKATLISAIGIPVLGLSILFSMEFGSQAPGVIAVVMVFGVAFTAVIIPYLIFLGVLITNYLRKRRR